VVVAEPEGLKMANIPPRRKRKSRLRNREDQTGPKKDRNGNHLGEGNRVNWGGRPRISGIDETI